MPAPRTPPPSFPHLPFSPSLGAAPRPLARPLAVWREARPGARAPAPGAWGWPGGKLPPTPPPLSPHPSLSPSSPARFSSFFKRAGAGEKRSKPARPPPRRPPPPRPPCGARAAARAREPCLCAETPSPSHLLAVCVYARRNTDSRVLLRFIHQSTKTHPPPPPTPLASARATHPPPVAVAVFCPHLNPATPLSREPARPSAPHPSRPHLPCHSENRV
jgi:hypothetical protein